MKKKLLYGFASTLLAAVMCVGFVACGETNAKNVVGEEFPEEQKAELWAAAFAEENFTNFKMVAKGTEKNEDGENVPIEMTFIVTEKGSYTKIPASMTNDKSKTGMYEMYIEKVEDGSYVYVKDEDGAWMKEKTSSVIDYGGLIAWAMLMSFADQAENYEYSAEWKGYIVPDEPATNEAPVLKFKGGKLVAIYSEEDDTNQSIVITYGKQKVSFPKATDVSEEVPEE